MANIALREMIRALRSDSPGIGLKKLTAQIKAVLPDDLAPEKKTVKEVCQHLDDENQPAAQTKPRDHTFYSRTKAAFEMFRDAERAYLLAFDKAKVRSVTRNPDAPDWFAASQLRHHFEILLTLRGKKPCTLAAMNPGYEMINGMVLQCPAPMMDQYELESYGFTLRYLTHDVLTEQLMHPGFKGGWIFADKHSEKWDKVEDIFLLPHPGRRNREDAVGEALGYPMPGGNGVVRIIDNTETSELERIAGEEVDSVIGMEFFCIRCNGEKLMMLHKYFVECKVAIKDIGIDLDVDTEGL
ncbi:hypothetical protein F4821DRAFT_272459 [Hypoxylon rubiginosum]|uniref:Uncharacterized protein n=1 Tax=Hypoxylon rubiginosum TaxID=110542 RepID=A0ACC0CPU9_9PEZI|nr:hypothetical protein F4821DRAFT_272459 [Hypoxylon rubiginosum]